MLKQESSPGSLRNQNTYNTKPATLLLLIRNGYPIKDSKYQSKLISGLAEGV